MGFKGADNERCRDPHGIKRGIEIDMICHNLKKMWLNHPGLRLGQMIDNSHSWAQNRNGSKSDLFYTEDNVLFKALEESLKT